MRPSTAMTKYKIRKNFLIAAILATGFVSLLIGIVAYFGLNMGTFVIHLKEDAYRAGIILSEQEDFKEAYPRLLVNPLTNAYPVDYNDIKKDEIINTDGDYYDSHGLTYIAYTFYLRNEGETTVDLSFDIDITEVTKNIDSAMRVMIIEDGVYEKIYLKDDESPKSIYDKTPDELCEYFNGYSVCSQGIENLRPGQVKKYSLVVWLEGWDAECTEAVVGGKLKMELLFSIISATIEG